MVVARLLILGLEGIKMKSKDILLLNETIRAYLQNLKTLFAINKTLKKEYVFMCKISISRF